MTFISILRAALPPSEAAGARLDVCDTNAKAECDDVMFPL